MVDYKMSEEDLKWQRRDDARTLARAEQIKADKERYKGAIIGAREIAKEELERVQGIAKVAGMKTPKVVSNEHTPQTNTIGPNIPCRPRRSNPATLGRF